MTEKPEFAVVEVPRPRLLIEDWLPVEALGIESRRERAASSALPPISYLHIWWARRPLVASAAVLLGGLLPAWSEALASEFGPHPQISTDRAYRAWFMRLIGIWGDPVSAKQAIDEAKLAGQRFQGDAYGYKQAFRNAVSPEDGELLLRILEHTWGEVPVVLDPTAGGGSIPFTSVRLGLPTFANDLNGVAASLLEAGIAVPSRHGLELLPHLERWGKRLVDEVARRVEPYFPMSGEKVTNYIYCNAVADPRGGRLVPLLTDKWLRKDPGEEAAVQIITERDGKTLDYPSFEVVERARVNAADASRGTVSRGVGISPYDGLVIEADYIKAQAQAGLMRQVVYAVVTRSAEGKRVYRAPNKADTDAILAAEERLRELSTDWAARDLLPTEEIPDGNDTRPMQYGMTKWSELYTPRQLLVHGTFADVYEEISRDIVADLGADMGGAVLVELALLQGKALNYNSRLSSWHITYQRTRSVFERHDFAFKWTFAEMEGGRDLYPWALSQVLKSYREISELLRSGYGGLLAETPTSNSTSVHVSQGNAADLSFLSDDSVTNVCMDPPYYDNVMYAELADFFYVWEKRTLGRVHPEFFKSELTDKDNEAVANPARFSAMGKRKNELADADYESKMTAIFAEARRVLRDDGVLSVMFTHKRAEAWDTLGMGLLEAGFTIETSWPVNTEAEQSLHQANMNSAASTIMLVCRKRQQRADSRRVFLDDIEAEIRTAARDASLRFHDAGIDGVDLLLATYGPALSVISKNWPVFSSSPDESGREMLLRPEDALAIAREEVVRLRRNRLIGRAAQIDDLTDFSLMAWDVFGAREFPFDTARLLALAVGGLDVDYLARAKIIEKKAGAVRILQPRERVRRLGDEEPGVHIDASRFGSLIDGVHTVLYVADVDGMHAAKALMDRSGLTENDAFLATIQGLVNAIPRVKQKGQWINPEAGLLDTLVTAYLPSISIPVEKAAPESAQASLFESE